MNKKHHQSTPNNLVIGLSNILQQFVVYFELLIGPFISRLFEAFNIKFVVIRRTEKELFDSGKLFNILWYYINQAVDIKFSVGEMSHQLMEREDIIQGLRLAKEQNKANIEIVHGPRVDLDSKRIFNLAEEGVVKLFRSKERYFAHHYIIFTLINGEEILIDESSHHEPIWYQAENGSWETKWESKVRFYYVIKSPSLRIKHLKEEFFRRKGYTEQIFAHPGINPTQSIGSFEFLWKSIINAFVKHVTQPLANVFDLPIDFNLQAIVYLIKNWLRNSRHKRSIHKDANTNNFSVDIPNAPALEIYANYDIQAKLDIDKSSFELNDIDLGVIMADLKKLGHLTTDHTQKQ